MTDLVLSVAPKTRVLTLDTGRVPPATEQIIDQIEQRYSMKIERIVPDAGEVDAMVKLHGRDLFYEKVPFRMLCCEIRKSRPLNIALQRAHRLLHRVAARPGEVARRYRGLRPHWGRGENQPAGLLDHRRRDPVYARA